MRRLHVCLLMLFTCPFFNEQHLIRLVRSEKIVIPEATVFLLYHLGHTEFVHSGEEVLLTAGLQGVGKQNQHGHSSLQNG